MKHILSILGRRSFPVFAGMVFCLSLASCDDDWGPGPAPGSSEFYDARLSGYWQLSQINGSPVTGTDVNYLFFNGSGRGVYYYYLDGDRYNELTTYWCQRSVSGNTRYQVKLDYGASGSPTTMNYWFSDGTRRLYFQWVNQNGVQTYLYSSYPGAPW